MLARVGKILGAVAIFLLAFYPVQVFVILLTLESARTLAWIFWLGSVSILLSLLTPLVWFHLTLRKMQPGEGNPQKSLRVMGLLFVGLTFLFLYLVLYTFVLPLGPIILLPYVPLGHAVVDLIIGTIVFVVGVILGLVLNLASLALAFILPLMYPIKVWNNLRSRIRLDPAWTNFRARYFWIIAPLYLSGGISLPLHVMLFLGSRAFRNV